MKLYDIVLMYFLCIKCKVYKILYLLKVALPFEKKADSHPSAMLKMVCNVLKVNITSNLVLNANEIIKYNILS